VKVAEQLESSLKGKGMEELKEIFVDMSKSRLSKLLSRFSKNTELYENIQKIVEGKRNNTK
jgi:hypothetical protein